jgi:hypothetical protein
MFGNDAFKRSLHACLERSSTIAMELVAELNAAPLICSEQSPQAGSTLDECFLAKVVAVEV